MQFDSALVTAREILAEYGAHGDLALAYQLRPFDHQVYFDATPNVGTRDVQGAPIVRTWTTFDEEAVGERVFAEIARVAGLGPRPAPNG